MFLYFCGLMIFHSLVGSAVASYIALRRSFAGDILVSSKRYFGNQGEWGDGGDCLVFWIMVWIPVPSFRKGVGVHIRFFCVVGVSVQCKLSLN